MTESREGSLEASATLGLPVGGGTSGATDPLLGRNIGKKFVLEKLLGEGAMGAVYRARQTALDKVVAIKVMHGELARDPMFAARFHREAKAASRLDHPNSIRIIDYGEDEDGLLYIAMEYLDGSDLAHILEKEWPLPVARAVDLLAQALGAIGVAHDLGITHRDLKPENIMVLQRTTDEGAKIEVVKVCDFGIAKLIEADDAPASVGPGTARGKLTTAGLVIGTPAYMSPEQGRGDVIDARSDLYSMGVILYQVLTGQVPFDATTPIGIVVKHQTDTAAPPSTINPNADRRLEAVCLKAMQKAPKDRYQTAREFRSALRGGSDTSAGLSSGIIARDVGVDRGQSSPGHTTDPRGTGGVPAAAISAPEMIAKTELFGAVDANQAGVPVVVSPPASPLASPALPTTQAMATSSAGQVTARLTPTPPAKRSSRWPVFVGIGAALVVAAGGVGAWEYLHHPKRFLTQREAPAPVAPSTPLLATTSDRLQGSATEGPAGTAPVAPAAAASAQKIVSTFRGQGMRPKEGPTPGGSQPSEPSPISATVVDPTLRVAVPPVAPPSAVAPPAPAPPPVSAVPPAAPAPPPAPAAPAYDLAHASVEVGGATNVQGTGANEINRMMRRVSDEITRCYRQALPNVAAGNAPVGEGTLNLDIDETGHVTDAKLHGPASGPLPAVRQLGCVRRAVVGQLVGGDITGRASADVPLVFKPQ